MPDTEFDIYATLPRNTTVEHLRQCRHNGATGVRIHTAKMNPRQVVTLIRNCHEADMHIMVDLPGIKVRTKDTPGMVTDTTIGEKGNRYLPLEEGERFFLVPITFSDEEIRRQFVGPNCTCLRASFIPPQLDLFDIVTFSDGEIVCTIENIALSQEHGKYLYLRVDSLSGKKGIYWNMGMASPSKDLFSGHSAVITASDQITLEAISEESLQDQVTEVAVSFVSEPSHLDDTIDKLRELGFNFERTSIVAKIETIESVRNLDTIARKIQELAQRNIHVIVEIGRGDLGDDCEAKGLSLAEQQVSILKTLRKYNIPIIIATNVASSAIQKIRSGEHFTRLTREERRQLIHEILCYLIGNKILGWMLAAETMITGEEGALEVIRRVYDTYQRAHRIATGVLKGNK